MAGQPGFCLIQLSAGAVIHTCRIKPPSSQTQVKAELCTTSISASDSQCTLLRVNGLHTTVALLCLETITENSLAHWAHYRRWTSTPQDSQRHPRSLSVQSMLGTMTTSDV